MGHFLVESYLPAGGALPTPGTGETVGARLLQTLYAPDDELCYLLFEGDSAEQVERVSQAAGLSIDRLVTVLLEVTA